MRGPKRWWILVLVVAALGAFACTENDLDESDADVVLELLGFSNPPVQGQVELGTCSITTTLPCLTKDNCPDNEVCVLPPAGSVCEINAWTFNFTNQPLSEGAIESPFNDIVMDSVTITYAGAGTSSVSLGGVAIPANGQGSVSFFPISQAMLAVTGDDTTLAVSLLFLGTTISGEPVSFSSGAQLFIEDCM